MVCGGEDREIVRFRRVEVWLGFDKLSLELRVGLLGFCVLFC